IAELARQAISQLDSQMKGVDEIMVPIWTTAKALAQARAQGFAAPADLLAEALERSFAGQPELVSVPPVVRAWLADAVATNRGFVMIDGLDELTDGEGADFRTAMAVMNRLKVIVTCRTMQWPERQS